MSNLDASSPQLQAAKKLFDLATSLNLDKLETIFSNNYRYEAFNGVTDLAKMDKERQVEVIRALLAGMTKVDVSVQQRRTIFTQADI